MDSALPAAARKGDLAARLSFDYPPSLIERVRARYAEPQRHYHTWTHVSACFDARDQLTSAALPAVDLALLFHDAVYDPLAPDNEDASAELLLDEGRRAGIDDRVLQRAHALVLATKHHEASDDDEEACLVLDADLSILGAERAVFDAYEREVRMEYAQVPQSMYTAARAKILRGILARPRIYSTRRGERLWEANARVNLAASIDALTAD